METSQEVDRELAFSRGLLQFYAGGTSVLEKSEKADLLDPLCWTVGLVGVRVLVFFFF